MEKEKSVTKPKKEKIEKEKIEKENIEKEVKPLITSRVLFISVLDKIYLVILILFFAGLTIVNLHGDITSISYGYWHRVGMELVIIVLTFLMYLLLNWFYRCAVKTILCLTKNEVYKESYVPFIRKEVSIPINKITGVSSHKYFWIFRCVIIHQYHRLPMVFFTWNNQEFKDKLNELITGRDKVVENKYEEKNMLDKDKYNYVLYVLIGIALALLVMGLIRFFAYTFSAERKVAGTYIYENNKIDLNKDGSCDIDDLVNRVSKCNWKYLKDKEEVVIEYTYKEGYYYYYDNTKVLNISYNKVNKSLNINGTVYKK